jgi:magnesium-transporting ATPase (P-type)
MNLENAKVLSIHDVLTQLQASDAGLSGEEANKRLVQYGHNVLEEHRASLLIKFLGYSGDRFPG